MILRSALLDQLGWLEHGFGTRLSPAAWPPARYANLRQIHSATVIETGASAQGMLGEGDGMVTRHRGVWLGVRTADCAPVILADQASRTAAVVHAGWRGTLAGIVRRALETMGAERGDAIVAAIGPTIGPCCFEVGPEVAAEFKPWWPQRADLEQKTNLDLPGTLHRQLLAAGVKADNIDLTGECTCCHAERYHSFRRDREASGRMVTAVRIRP